MSPTLWDTRGSVAGVTTFLFLTNVLLPPKLVIF